MRADKIMAGLIFFVIVVVGVILFMNRGSARIFDNALLVILTTTLTAGLGSLLVILRPETRTEEFIAVYIYDSKEARPLLTEIYPVRKRMMVESQLWPYAEAPGGAEKTEGVNKPTEDRLLDFMMRSIVDRFCRMYRDAWLIQVRSWSVPGADVSSWGPSDDANKLSKIELLKEQLLRELQSGGNAFASIETKATALSEKMSAPPETTVSYAGGRIRELSLRNPYVEVRITAQFNSMHVLQQSFYDVFEIDQSAPNRYYQYSFPVRIVAHFSSWRAGWPNMTYQKRWVDSMITALKQTLDWNLIAAEIKEAWIEERLKRLAGSVHNH